MKFLGKNWHLKRTLSSMYPSIVFGVELAVSQCANRLGLKVPVVQLLSGDTIGVETVPGAKTIAELDVDPKPLSDAALLDLAKLIVFDYCVGCVNVYEDGELLRDIDNYPCYSERHDKNILWDGTSLWYIDYGHVFGRTLMLFSVGSPTSAGLSNTLPPYGTSSAWFHEQFHNAISLKRNEAVYRIQTLAQGGAVEFQPNIWLNRDTAEEMRDIFLRRLEQLL